MNNPTTFFLALVMLACCSGAFAQGSYTALIGMNEEILELARPEQRDGVPDLSRRAVEMQRAQLEDFRGRLLDIDTSSWSVPQQVDYLLVWSKMNDIVFQHRVMQPWSRDPPDLSVPVPGHTPCGGSIDARGTGSVVPGTQGRAGDGG